MHQRETERADLQHLLMDGASIHMPAPRRIGKTWTIDRLAGDLREAGCTVVQLDVEGMRTTRTFAENLCRQIESQAPVMTRVKSHWYERLNTLLSGAWEKPLDGLAKLNPETFIETLISALHEDHRPTVILIDEIAYFVLALVEADPVQAKDFVYRLRSFQQRYSNVRWLLTGSIGLDIIARRYRLEGAFVDLQTYVLRPLSPEAARSLLRDPAFGTKFAATSDDNLNWMLADIGWLAPYYLRLVTREVRLATSAAGTPQPSAGRAEIDAALEAMLHPNHRMVFAVWREHVEKNFTQAEAALAFPMLARLSDHRDGERVETLHTVATAIQGSISIGDVKKVLQMLCDADLLTCRDGRYAFLSNLVRRHWQKYQT
ncbi:MAG: ATP-binding protein [Alphaproteobacteria bacterium]|nr:ATP-binding protein [Alphaproteobacteria bacterium]